MRKKTDDNHKEIIRVLRQLPTVSVIDLSAVGQGCPDLLVGYQGKNYLIEIKNSKVKGKLNERQNRFFIEWKGQSSIVSSVDELLIFFGYQSIII